MNQIRYDVIYTGFKGPYIDFHFCREWDGDKDCYGTNPDHGFTWEEARDEVIKYWAALEEEDTITWAEK